MYANSSFSESLQFDYLQYAYNTAQTVDKRHYCTFIQLSFHHNHTAQIAIHYRQHCTHCKAPEYKLLRGWFWRFFDQQRRYIAPM